MRLRGADLDGATIARGGDAGGHLDSRVEVVGLQDEPAADSFLDRHERAVRRQHSRLAQERESGRQRAEGDLISGGERSAACGRQCVGRVVPTVRD